jgi:anti-sigma factor RsiW
LSHELNISNYESWFLSYIDGELNKEELELLQQFLLNHPHLQQELELLEGTKIVPDTSVVFDFKSSLYRQSVISEAYSAAMLSYLDGELDAAAAEELKQYLDAHSDAAKEFALLSQTKLVPDTNITFNDKASLYRHSKKPGVIYRRIGWSAAVAAVVAGFVIFVSAPHQPQPAQPVPTIVAVKPAETSIIAPPATEEQPPVVIAAVTPKESASPNPLPKPASRTVKQAVAAPVQNQVAAAPISQLPPQRNATEEVVTEHLQQVASTRTEPVPVEIKRETILASNTQIVNKSIEDSKPVVTAAPQSPPGELIISVSGSDSKVLDKVTNVAKLFSRRRK